MANPYINSVSTKVTPQSEAVRGKNQVKNNAGGYVFAVDNWTRLQRFCILGHEGGTYYADQRKLTYEAVDCIDACICEDLERTVNTIVGISQAGRAPKNDAAIFALAYIAGRFSGTPAASKALAHLNDVCRIGTHLFDFLTAVQNFRGWGNSLRNAVARWYTERSPIALARQVTKYRQRNGWSHRDVLRKAHPQATGLTNEVLQYVTQHDDWVAYEGVDVNSETTQFLLAVDEAQTATKRRLLTLIKDFGLVREHIPTEMLNDRDIWGALLINMPMTALIRNLGKMSNIGLLKPLSSEATMVANKLRDADAVKAARLHPVSSLVALRQYQAGRGLRGSLTWQPVPQVIEALEAAFWAGFDAVEPTNLNYYLGVDCSGSMGGPCAGAPNLKCIEGAACMALFAAKTEPNYYVRGFASGSSRWGAADGMKDLNITAGDGLQEACRKALSINWGGTDLALPMIDAMNQGLDVDVFCVYTDNETWAGNIHPFQALQQYRQKTGKNAKLAVFGMADNNFTIADPSDAGMMDFCGFDTNAPAVLADFATN